jgi:hypothetical protein
MTTSADLDVPFTTPRLNGRLEQTHVALAVTPNDDRMLRYQLMVPATWAYSKQLGPVVDELLVPKAIGLVAQGTSPDAPIIAVTVTTFPCEIPIDAWLRLRLARDGWQLVAGRWVSGPHALYYDATAVRGDEVMRTSVRCDGNRVFMVATRCARRHWDAVKETFLIAHVSFQVLGTTGTTQMEAHKSIELVHPDFRIEYPFSWVATPVESPWPSVSAVDVRLSGGGGTRLLAYLQVRAERRDPRNGRPRLEALQTETLGKLRKAGFHPAGPFVPLKPADDPRGPAVGGWVGGFLGTGKLGEADAEVRFGYVQRADITFTLLATCPPARDDVLTSLRAARAFEIARETLQLPEAR